MVVKGANATGATHLGSGPQPLEAQRLIDLRPPNLNHEFYPKPPAPGKDFPARFGGSKTSDSPMEQFISEGVIISVRLSTAATAPHIRPTQSWRIPPMANVKPIPPGYTSVTPSITVKDTPRVIEFYKKALGATERMRMPGPDGKIMHAEIQIGNSIIMMNDEVMGSRSAQTVGGCPISLYLYVENVDSAFKKAIEAGGKQIYPVTDMFWGDRMGSFEDPFGHKWTIATHVKDVSPQEMKKGQEEFMKQMAGAR